MKTLHASIIALLLVAFGFIMIQTGKQLQLGAMRRAYSLCLAAHAEVNGDSERACGDAQDQTHTEFLCDKAGEYCWLEVK